MSDERVFGMDLARGTAVFCLVPVHTLWMYGTEQVQSASVFGSIIHTLGQGSGAFLIAMGFSLMLTRHQSLKYALQRGLLVFAAGYALNVLKFIVPISVFGTMPEAFVAAYGWQSPVSANELAYLFMTGDILQMAGLSFILAGLVRRWVTSKYLMLALAGGAILFYELMRGYRLGVPGIDYAMDLLWGTEWNVYFPVFPWIANILVGMYLGICYRESAQGGARTGEEGMYRGALMLGVAALIVGGGLCWWNWGYHFNDFFHTGPGGAVLLVGANLCFFYVYAKWLTRALQRRGWFVAGVRYLSARVTSFYFVQWTLVCWGMGIVGYKTLGVAELLALMPVMWVLSIGLDYWLKRLMAVARVRLAAWPEWRGLRAPAERAAE